MRRSRRSRRIRRRRSRSSRSRRSRSRRTPEEVQKDTSCRVLTVMRFRCCPPTCLQINMLSQTMIPGGNSPNNRRRSQKIEHTAVAVEKRTKSKPLYLSHIIVFCARALSSLHEHTRQTIFAFVGPCCKQLCTQQGPASRASH